MKILNKEMSYKLYEDGEFGNKLRTWNSLNDLREDAYTGSVTMRYAGEYGKWCEYNVAQDVISNVISTWYMAGADVTLIRYNESAPDDCLIIQGEFMLDKEYRYALSYSTDKVNMREAMKSSKDLIGIKAITLLQSHLSKASMRNMKHLLHKYPEAVIEFSVYDHFLGNVPENNTVFWEVRNY